MFQIPEKLWMKVYRTGAPGNITELPAEILSLEPELLSNPLEKYDPMAVIRDLSRAPEVVGFRILPPGDMRPAHEEFYPMCYFGEKTKDGLAARPTNSSFRGVISFELRNYDYLFETGTGECTRGAERLPAIVLMPPAEVPERCKAAKIPSLGRDIFTAIIPEPPVRIDTRRPQPPQNNAGRGRDDDCPF